MRTELRDKWYTFISNDDSITVEWIYNLLNPKDKDEFFKIVNTIITRHSQDENEEENKLNYVWTKEYKMMFKLTAVEYLIEFEKDQSSNNQFFIPSTSPVIYPSYPTNIPGVPSLTDPYPLQLPQVWCVNTPANNQYFCTTTSIK